MTYALALVPTLAAQHSHGAPQASTDSVGRDASAKGESATTAGVATDAVMGSGTSWLPRTAPVRGAHLTAGDWTVMLHGVAYGQYIRQSGPRGGWHAGSINWGMVGAARPAAGGRLELRAMVSAEPFTLDEAGYPHLLQTGETYLGIPLHDRQHPHELVMELSTRLERRLAGPVGGSLYVAAVGEPAAGPVAFMHRPSGMADPFSPLSHHWQDGSHTTFGVITAGVFTRRVMLEASLFNGREPDETRTNFDYKGRKLDSYSARLTLAPTQSWTLSAWYAFLESPEAFFPLEWHKRIGASVLHSMPVGTHGAWSSALIWGANRHERSAHHPFVRFTHSATAETSLELGKRNTLFARYDYVEKSVEELFIPHFREEIYPVHSIAAGYVLDVMRVRGAALGVGARGSLNFLSTRLYNSYGDTRPKGGAVFARLTFDRRTARHGAHAEP